MPLIYVVGPSGAGKDSLLAWLKANWPGPGRVHLARRTITRPAQAGGEQHESVLADEFQTLLAQGHFALHWSAHGLQYGIRKTELTNQSASDWVFVNGSREHLHAATHQHPNLLVLHVTAPADVLVQRLTSRGREPQHEVSARLKRAPALPAVPAANWFEVSNHGLLADAGVRVRDWLQGVAPRAME